MKSIFCLFVFYTFTLSAQSKKIKASPEKKDTLNLSIGVDLMQFSQGTIHVEADYKIFPQFSVKTAIGATYYTALQINNSELNTLKGFFIKAGPNLKLLSNKKGTESWIYGTEFLYSFGRHTSIVHIKHAYGTFKGTVNNDYHIFGLGFSLTKVIRFSPKIYADLGPIFHILTVKQGVFTDSFAPGAGATTLYNPEAIFPTTSLTLKCNLRYRFNLPHN